MPLMRRNGGRTRIFKIGLRIVYDTFPVVIANSMML